MPNQQINNNSKSCICYGNAVVGTILFIFSFCSIVFIIIFVEYHEICDVPATTPILPSSATNLPALSERHFQDENNPFNPNQEDEEQKIQDDFLKAIENKSADDDQMSLDYDAEYEEEISYNITKLIATALQLEPDKVLHYMSRSEWQISDKATTDETGNLPTLRLPVKRIIVAHTGGKSCNSTVTFMRGFPLSLFLFNPIVRLDTEWKHGETRVLETKYLLGRSRNPAAVEFRELKATFRNVTRM